MRPVFVQVSPNPKGDGKARVLLAEIAAGRAGIPVPHIVERRAQGKCMRARPYVLIGQSRGSGRLRRVGFRVRQILTVGHRILTRQHVDRAGIVGQHHHALARRPVEAHFAPEQFSRVDAIAHGGFLVPVGGEVAQVPGDGQARQQQLLIHHGDRVGVRRRDGNEGAVVGDGGRGAQGRVDVDAIRAGEDAARAFRFRQRAPVVQRERLRGRGCAFPQRIVFARVPEIRLVLDPDRLAIVGVEDDVLIGDVHDGRNEDDNVGRPQRSGQRLLFVFQRQGRIEVDAVIGDEEIAVALDVAVADEPGRHQRIEDEGAVARRDGSPVEIGVAQFAGRKRPHACRQRLRVGLRLVG